MLKQSAVAAANLQISTQKPNILLLSRFIYRYNKQEIMPRRTPQKAQLSPTSRMHIFLLKICISAVTLCSRARLTRPRVLYAVIRTCGAVLSYGPALRCPIDQRLPSGRASTLSLRRRHAVPKLQCTQPTDLKQFFYFFFITQTSKTSATLSLDSSYSESACTTQTPKLSRCFSKAGRASALVRASEVFASEGTSFTATYCIST